MVDEASPEITKTVIRITAQTAMTEKRNAFPFFSKLLPIGVKGESSVPSAGER